MQGTNITVQTGNLTRDPELRSTPGGTSVCKLRIAVNGRRKLNGVWVDKPNFFDVTLWGTTAENAAKYLAKGRMVLVEGRLDWREWEAKDGSKRQAVEIVAERFRSLSPREERAEDAEDEPADSSERELAGVGAGADPGEDDIPF